MTVVEEELRSVPTSGPIVVRINKDSRLALSFDPRDKRVDERDVDNDGWQFIAAELPPIIVHPGNLPGGGVVAFGLRGVLSPGRPRAL